jgi:5-methylcytosine-specific restriction endonuclease McrA
MSWDNIQIDHYVPIKCFDIFNDIEMKIAWNIDNLNPVTAEENKAKNSKIPNDANEHIRNICKKIGIKYGFKQLG